MPYIRNKRTGETIFVPDEPASPQGIPIGMQDPAMPYKAQGAALDNQSKVAGMQNDAQRIALERERVRLAQMAQGNAATAAQQTHEIKQRDVRQNPISDRDQTLINGMRGQQGDLSGVLRDIAAAQDAVKRFSPSPARGRLFSMGVPEEDDWAVTAAAKNLFGLALPDQDKEDYQRLVGLQSQGVLNSQIAQKGPQTESDAARMKLANVSPNKDVRVNADILAEQQYDTLMKQSRAGFYETWANNLGSTHAINGQGKTADQVWAEQYDRGLRQMREKTNARRSTGAPRKGGGTSMGWYGVPKDAPRKGGDWKIERVPD